MRYSDDRIAAIEHEGRKYRSRTLLTKAMRDSDERDRNVRAGREVLKKDTGNAFILIMYVFEAVLFLGVIGLLDMDKGYMPLWLSIVLMILGGLGFLLVVRLRDRLRREAVDEVSLGKRAKEKIEREADAFRVKIDAGWQAIISQPGILLHEAGIQYEEFLKEVFDAEEKRRKRDERWNYSLGGIFALGLLTAFWGYMALSSVERSASGLYGATLIHAAGLIFGVVLAVKNWPQRDRTALESERGRHLRLSGNGLLGQEPTNGSTPASRLRAPSASAGTSVPARRCRG